MGLAEIERQDFPPPAQGVLQACPEGFRIVNAFPREAALPSYLSGDPESRAVRVSYFYRDSDRFLKANAWLGPGAKGPPAHAHGGAMAALLDESMGVCAWQAGIPVLAAKIEITYRRSLPLGSVVLVEAWIERIEGRKLWLASRLLGADGELYSEGTGLFLELNDAQKAAFEVYREENPV